nr:uncharacterized protein LOC127312271 [Lolium perenne]
MGASQQASRAIFSSPSVFSSSLPPHVGLPLLRFACSSGLLPAVRVASVLHHHGHTRRRARPATSTPSSSLLHLRSATLQVLRALLIFVDARCSSPQRHALVSAQLRCVPRFITCMQRRPPPRWSTLSSRLGQAPRRRLSTTSRSPSSACCRFCPCSTAAAHTGALRLRLRRLRLRTRESARHARMSPSMSASVSMHITTPSASSDSRSWQLLAVSPPNSSAPSSPFVPSASCSTAARRTSLVRDPGATSAADPSQCLVSSTQTRASVTRARSLRICFFPDRIAKWCGEIR